jgi:hypothetical protein
MPDGSVIYRFSDRSRHVKLSRRDWERLEGYFSDQVKPIKRQTNIAAIALLPALFIFAMTIGQFLPFTGIVIVFGIFVMPIALYIRHAYLVGQAVERLEIVLNDFPSSPAPPADPKREPRVLEIAIIAIVGPQLLVNLIGEIGGPGTFRNTPWSGASIGAFDLLAYALIVARLAWPQFAKRKMSR